MSIRNTPITRIGWHRYYVKRFNKTELPEAEQMACWYLLLHLEHDA